MPLVRWQLAVLQSALASRNIAAARRTRHNLFQAQARLRGEADASADEGEDEESGDEAGAWEAGGGDGGVQVQRKAAGDKAHERGGGEGKRGFVAPVSKEKEMGRRKRYGLFLPLPGHVSGPTRSTIWDADDVNAHVRFDYSLQFHPSLKPVVPKRAVSSQSDEAEA